MREKMGYPKTTSRLLLQIGILVALLVVMISSHVSSRELAEESPKTMGNKTLDGVGDDDKSLFGGPWKWWWHHHLGFWKWWHAHKWLHHHGHGGFGKSEAGDGAGAAGVGGGQPGYGGGSAGASGGKPGYDGGAAEKETRT